MQYFPMLWGVISVLHPYYLKAPWLYTKKKTVSNESLKSCLKGTVAQNNLIPKSGQNGYINFWIKCVLQKFPKIYWGNVNLIKCWCILVPENISIQFCGAKYVLIHNFAEQRLHCSMNLWSKVWKLYEFVEQICPANL